MGERKGVNKYYPPDWDPSKGSINQYVGQHPLRERARKLSQGILIIRFEMPYNIWCGGCNSHIGMGVRYNAEKTKTGMYYTTPIYKFRMKCHLCNNHFEIQTDPKNHDYVILEGARRKEQRWDPKENEQIVTEDKAVQKKMATDAMFKLEHGSDDIQKGKKMISNLGSLEVRRDQWKDDYMLNKLARQKFREEKKALKVEADGDSALLAKSSLDIPLQKETEDDIKLAGLIKYRTLESYDEKQAEKRKEIESRPLFGPANKVAKTDNRSPDSKKFDIIKKQVKTVRANFHVSPFDRAKMNTLGPAISKESLGIRKKCLPKFSTRLQNEKDGKDSCDKQDSGNASNDGSCSFDLEDREKIIGLDNTACTLCGKQLPHHENDLPQSNFSACLCKSDCVSNESNSDSEGALESEGSAACGKEVTSSTVCGKEVTSSTADGKKVTSSTAVGKKVTSSAADRIEVTCSAAGSKEVTNSAAGGKEVTSFAAGGKEVTSSAEENSCTKDTEKSSNSENPNDQQELKRSGLGLVCSYSDTDSDAST